MSTLPSLHSTITDFSYHCLHNVCDNYGFCASDRSEVYGCLFGRDSAITILNILRAMEGSTADAALVGMCKTTLQSHCALQGTAHNIESGEEPGKFIHEFRPTNYDRLINRPQPWYVYPDGILRNYDSVDATPLLLIALWRFYQFTKDNQFLLQVQTHVENGLAYLVRTIEQHPQKMLAYTLPSERKHGGLCVQSWADSKDSLLTALGSFPQYPIAPVEAQAIAWLALREWADFFATNNPSFARTLLATAQNLELSFQKFLYQQDGQLYAAQAIDGLGNQIRTVTANPLLCLYATHQFQGQQTAIVSWEVLGQLVERAFQPDLFSPQAGLRTMSTLSPTFNATATSYHNGSFWPMLNGLIYDGLLQWGFYQPAQRLYAATLAPITYFGSPIELYGYDETRGYFEYQSLSGKKGCLYQAWTAAVLLNMTAHPPL